MFHAGKGKRTKGREFVAMSNDAAEKDVAVKFVLNTHCSFMIRLWGKSKHVSSPWINWDPRKRSKYQQVLYILRNNILKD